MTEGGTTTENRNGRRSAPVAGLMFEWRGFLGLGTGWMIYVGPVGPTALHAHHAFQLMRAVSGRLRLRDAAGASIVEKGAIVPPDQAHAFTDPASLAILLYVEPESWTGQRLLEVYPRGGPAPSWPCPALAKLALEPAPDRTASDTARSMLSAVLGRAQVFSPLHPGLRRAIQVIADSLDDRVRLDDVAEAVGLSRSRLSHLFAEQLGIGFRPFVLWKRLERAAHRLGAGDNLTQAAHAAGFADASHLSRTFRRMFGIAPSELAGCTRFGLLDEHVPR